MHNGNLVNHLILRSELESKGIRLTEEDLAHSPRVDLPWSTGAMMEKFLILSIIYIQVQQ